MDSRYIFSICKGKLLKLRQYKYEYGNKCFFIVLVMAACQKAFKRNHNAYHVQNINWKTNGKPFAFKKSIFLYIKRKNTHILDKKEKLGS